MVEDSPQDSILGPSFFNIFLNDMLQFLEKTDIYNFADGSTVYSCVKSTIWPEDSIKMV